MKRWMAIILVLVMTALLLAGCGHAHTWVEATCTEPKTCAECKETEGEPLGHDWKAATCTEPEICARCGAKQGEPLGHTPTEADYWTPSVCAVCGKELGPVLTPGFEQHGLACDMVVGETYDYVATCYNDPEKTTVGKATITNYEVVPAIENYEAVPGITWNFEAREGYEWRVLTIQYLFDDEIAWKYGWTVGSCMADYYDIEHPDDTRVYVDPTPDYGTDSTWDLVYKGEHYEGRRIVASQSSGWINHSLTFTVSVANQVPVGYDGCVYGFRNRDKEWDEGMYVYDVVDENSMFFRLK